MNGNPMRTERLDALLSTPDTAPNPTAAKAPDDGIGNAGFGGGDAGGGGCGGSESFALRVLGTDMAPEFNHGDIVVIEPDGALDDGRFVLAQVDDDWLLRQLKRSGNGWALRALNPEAGIADQPLADLAAVHGIVIQKAVPGRRRLSKSYL